jgi:hypothetical protein
MHYLIQKSTRQHIAVADDMPCPVECVKVRADADGWVKHSGGAGCPVPINSRVDVLGVGARFENSDVLRSRRAEDINWSRVAQYRPDCDTIMARAGETVADTAPGHEAAAMFLSVLCAFALGALIGWGWM